MGVLVWGYEAWESDFCDFGLWMLKAGVWDCWDPIHSDVLGEVTFDQERFSFRNSREYEWSCIYDEWSNLDPELEYIYIGKEKTLVEKGAQNASNIGQSCH